MKLCLIGNSYIVALKDALDDDPRLLPEGPGFLFAPGSELDVDLRDGCLAPRAARARIVDASGPATTLLLDDYDAFAIVGLGLSPVHCGRIYRSARLWRHADASHRLLSRAALLAAATGLLRETIAARVAALLRGTTDRPVVLTPQPVPVARLQRIACTTPYLERVRDSWAPFFDPDVAAVLDEAFAGAARRLGHEIGVDFVPQPPDTRDGFFTRDMFRTTMRVSFDADPDAGRNRPETDVDVTHMNAAYGRRAIKSIVAALRRDALSAPLPD